MSVNLNTGPSPMHPIDEPEIAHKINAFNELTTKIRRMAPITIFCLSREYDSGSGQGVSSYIYTYYTTQDAAISDQMGSGLSSECFPITAVMDDFRDIYKVSFKSTLELTKLTVQRHLEEKQLYNNAQKMKI